MTIGHLFGTILEKEYSHIRKKHSHISKCRLSYQQSSILQTFIKIAKFIVFSTFASEFLIYTDNEYTDFFFPTYVCLRFLGDIDRMHPIL